MDYNNLTQLLSESYDSRRYFMNLPNDIQIELHKYNDSIRTSADLTNMVNKLNADKSFGAVEFPHEYFMY